MPYKTWKEKYQEYLDHLHSPFWYQLKDQRLALCGYQCERCGNRNLDQLELHHNRPYRECLFRETVADVLIWCGACHSAEHGTKRGRVELQAFDNLDIPSIDEQIS